MEKRPAQPISDSSTENEKPVKKTQTVNRSKFTRLTNAQLALASRSYVQERNSRNNLKRAERKRQQEEEQKKHRDNLL